MSQRGSFRSARTHCLLILALIGVVIALPIFASATLPDQTWIAGIYDGADDDDVVLAAISLQGLFTLPAPSLAPVLTSPDPVSAIMSAHWPLVSVLLTGIRAPPTS